MTNFTRALRSRRLLRACNDTRWDETGSRRVSNCSSVLRRMSNEGPSATDAETIVVERMIAERRLRGSFVPGGLFRDPAWDMLLELLHAELTSRPVTEALLSKAAQLSEKTGMRWIEALVANGFCDRCPSLADGENEMLQLSTFGRNSLRQYFSEVAKVPQFGRRYT